MNKDHQIALIKKELKKRNIPFDLIDLEAEVDETLTYAENRSHIIQFITSDVLKPKSDVIKYNEQLAKEQQEKLIKEEENRLIEEWKSKEPTKIDIPQFETAKDLVTIVAKGFHHSMILTGDGGIGKTYIVINTVKTITKDFIYISGFITPLSLFKILYKNKDKLIIMDDLEGVFSNEKSIAILKGALWDTDGKRIVQYISTTGRKSDIPDKFEFTGRLIILCNEIPMPKKNIISLKAMISRTMSYDLKLSYNEKIQIIKNIVKKNKDLTEEQKKLLMNIIKKNTSPATKDLNLRTMQRLISYIKYDKKKAESIFKETTPTDENLELLWELLNSNKSISEQVKEFRERVGMSRATFFRKRKILMKRIKR